MAIGEGFPTSQPEDEIVIRDGIPGTLGFKGDFLPVTTDYGVSINTDESGNTVVESIIPGSLAEPTYEVVDELFADDPETRNRLLVMPAIRRTVERLREKN